jgi:type VI secretion system protein ImpL
VDEHFRGIHMFVAGDKDHPGGLEPAIQKINALYQGLNAAASAPNPGQMQLSALAGGGGGAAVQLKDLSKDLPKPVAAMLATVSQGSSAITASGASSALSDGWKSKVLPLCDAAFGRYPFVAGSSADVPIDDFTRLLGPGGLIDGFFNDNLKPFVDTSSTPWHWQAADHTSLGLSPGTLTQFERAALIRDSLFSAGTAMQVRFQLLPVSLDPSLAKVSVDIAGTSLTYDHGPAESTSFQWPGVGGRTLVRVTFTPTGAGSGTVIERDGSWALLRLLDAARVIPSGQPDKFRVVFSAPSGSAEFELTASSVRNPFTMSALRNFRCPSRL